jgi:hypothetical protein
MPYDPKELVELPAEIIALVAEVKDATSASSAGGTKVTREERRRIIRAAMQLAWTMIRDGLD